MQSPKPNRCIIIGGGSSIRQDQWQTKVKDLELWKKISNEFTVGINSLYKWVPTTMTMFGDYNLYWHEKQFFDALPLAVGRFDNRFYGQLSEIGDNILLIKTIGKWFPKDFWTKGFYRGSLTGSFAISFLYTLGFTEIYLLGYDFCEINGKTHFYEDEIDHTEIMDARDKVMARPRWRGVGKRINKSGQEIYNTGHYDNDPAGFFKPFETIADSVKIYNVSLQSRIASFPKISYEEFYQRLQNNPVCFNQQEAQEEVKRIILSHAK